MPTPVPNYEFKTTPYRHQGFEGALSRWNEEAWGYLLEMGCVDGDTEYLAPDGWHKISDYTSGLVAQFNLDGTAEFVKPGGFLKKPVDQFYHFKTERGVDQVLSKNHRILCAGPRSLKWNFPEVPVEVLGRTKEAYVEYWRETSPADIKTHAVVPTTFKLNSGKGVNLSEAQIRLQIAFNADGSYGTKDLSTITSRRKGAVRVKHAYKKQRMRELLERNGIPWEEREKDDGFSIFVFNPPVVTKTFPIEWWEMTPQQREVVCDEIWQWDGQNTKAGGIHYSSLHKNDADFIQWCFVSLNRRAAVRTDSDGISHVQVIGKGRTRNMAILPEPVLYEGEHDGFMYCFNVPSSYLVLRRNGRVFVTGNTGKSKIFIDNGCILFEANEIDTIFILAPKGVYQNWVNKEIPAHMPDRILKNAKIHLWRGGHTRTEWKELEEICTESPGKLRIFVANLEAVAGGDKLEKWALRFLKSGRCLMGIDEASRIKNPTAKTTKICIRWGRLAEYRRIMTGTPVPRSPLDLWAQCEFLESGCLGYRNFFLFRAKYAIMEKKMFGGREIQIVVGHRYTDQLSNTLSGIATIIRKEDCLDLPPKVFEEWEVTLTPEQTRVYTELKTFATSELEAGKFVTSTTVITTLLRMQQIVCGYVPDEHGTLHRIPTNRPAQLLNAMEERKGEKTIIWCNFREDIELVREALEKDGFKVVTYHGGTSTEDRAEAIYRFQGERAGPGGATDYCSPDQQAEVFLGTEHAGGYGITLTAADMVIYYSNGFDLEKRLQSEDRAHRIGQTRSVTYIDMVARGTVDEKVITALKKKEQLANIIMDGPARIRDLFG